MGQRLRIVKIAQAEVYLVLIDLLNQIEIEGAVVQIF